MIGHGGLLRAFSFARPIRSYWGGGGGGGGGVVHGGMTSTVLPRNFGCHIDIEPTSVYATAI